MIDKTFKEFNASNLSRVIKRNKFISKIPFVSPVKASNDFSRYKLDDGVKTLVVEHRSRQSVIALTDVGKVVSPISTHEMKNGRCFHVIDANDLTRTFNLEVIENVETK